MKQSVPSQVLRSLRGVGFTLAATLIGLTLPAAALAGPPVVTKPVVTNVVFDTYSGYALADATSDVTSNGGAPPIWERGFLISETANPPDLSGIGINVTPIYIPGTLGTMTRTLTTVTPGATYYLVGYARNYDPTDPVGYSPVETFTAACPVISMGPLPATSSVGASYASSINTVGGYGWGFLFSVTSGALPDGLTLDPNSGVVSGTPTTVGVSNFTITARDAIWTLCGAARSYTLAVESLDVSPRKLSFSSELFISPGPGVSSPSKTVTVTNTSAAAMPLASIVSSAPEFVVASSTCGVPPTAVPATSSCTLDVVYTPSSASAHTGTLSVGGIVVSLRGAGAAAAVSQVYAANAGAATLSVIDPVTNTIRGTIGVGTTPGPMAALPGGGRLYVPNEYSHTVSVIDTATNTWIKDITDATLYGPAAVAPTPDGKEVWVVNGWGDSISIVDTASDAVSLSISNGAGCMSGPRGIVANPATHEMYVISQYNGAVCAFDRLTRGFLRQFYVGGGPSYGVVLPNGSALYVNSGTAGAASRIDLASGTVTYIADAQGAHMDMKADGSKIYIARQANGVGVIQTATNTFTDVPLTGVSSTRGVAVHDAGGRVYVTDESGHVVYVVDLATDTEIPNPELPIKDPSFFYPGAIAAIKAPVIIPPLAVPPTVTGPTATPASLVALLGANVTSDGGMPVFERGFALSDTDTTPVPGESGVWTFPVAGTTGAMSTTAMNLSPTTTYYYQAYAKNFVGTGLSGEASFVTGGCPAITLDPASIPPLTMLGDFFSVTLTASGGTGPYAFSLIDGALPPGVSLSGNTASGTPTTAGYYGFQFRVVDPPTGCTQDVSYTLIVGTPVSPGDVVISEFRTRGVAGDLDEYVEIANQTSADIVVAALDGSGGWSIGTRDGLAVRIDDGTVIPKGGHWLATGELFSLYSYGTPNDVWYGDAYLALDLPDDGGVALFDTANPSEYVNSTPLDAVGGVAETDPLFYEGTPLVAVVQAGPSDPAGQTAWVRRQTSSGSLSDGNDNDRDFIFVAGDAGTTYGPAGDVAAVLGAPGPEDTYTVHDVLQSEFPVSLVDPSKAENRVPNRVVYPFSSVEYRRLFKNNTGKDITGLAFKVTDLTTVNSRQTLAVRQAALLATTAPSLQLEVPLGSSNLIDLHGAQIDDRPSGLHALDAYCEYDPQTEGTICYKAGGVNSRLLVPLGAQRFGGGAGLRAGNAFKSPPLALAPGDTIGVNFKAVIDSTGYYVWVVMPQVTFEPISIPGLRSGAGKSRRERTGIRPSVRK